MNCMAQYMMPFERNLCVLQHTRIHLKYLRTLCASYAVAIHFLDNLRILENDFLFIISWCIPDIYVCMYIYFNLQIICNKTL